MQYCEDRSPDDTDSKRGVGDMSGNRKRFERYVMSLSYEKRRARRLLRYKERAQELEGMNLDELEFEYVFVKSAYEHKKGILMASIFFMILVFLMDLWSYFFWFMWEMNLYGMTVAGIGIKMVDVGIEFALMLILFVAFIILMVLVMHLRDLNRMRENLLIIENVRKNTVEGRKGR